jgi:hypothetical protein
MMFFPLWLRKRGKRSVSLPLLRRPKKVTVTRRLTTLKTCLERLVVFILPLLLLRKRLKLMKPNNFKFLQPGLVHHHLLFPLCVLAMKLATRKKS